ncbi:MAG TPA: phytanoyl-CoA dioxygenase family protein [Chryseolinea sp.]|nr:phytanoyl-CoA dioxygenase family protein [Chryseolinea sp.]
MEYTVNDVSISYEASGEKTWGDDRILLEHAVDLTASTSWHDKGFTIEPFLDSKSYGLFRQQAHALLLDCWKKAGLVPSDDFRLDQYHTLVKNFNEHLAALDKTKLLPVEEFPIPLTQLEDRVSQICGMQVEVKNPYDGQKIFHFRVIRPQQWDNNPLHRDIWLQDYDDCINLYIPLAGSNERSSLILVPGSHLWPESRVERTISGAEINGVKYNVPAVTAIDGPYSIERPNPSENQLLVFSPYLIHGGAVNLDKHESRISIEIRLWKK